MHVFVFYLQFFILKNIRQIPWFTSEFMKNHEKSSYLNNIIWQGVCNFLCLFVCIQPFMCDFPFARYLAPTKLHKFCEKSEKCIKIILSKGLYGQLIYQINALDVLNLNICLTCTRDLYIRNFWRQSFKHFAKIQ